MRTARKAGLMCLLWAGISLARAGTVSADLETVLGRNLFVNQAHPAASDDNPGTRDLPFQTIAGSLPHLREGDTVHIRAGVYRESVVLRPEEWTRTGREFPPVPPGLTFAGYPGEEVVIKGSDVVTGWERYRDDIWVRRDWPHDSHQVFCDGVILRQIGAVLPASHQRWLPGHAGQGVDDLAPVSSFRMSDQREDHRDLWWIDVPAGGSFHYDPEAKALYVWLKDGRDPNEHLMEVGVRNRVFSIFSERNELVGLKMMHSGGTGNMLNVWGAHNLVRNVAVSWGAYGGLNLGGYSNTVLDSSFNWNGNNGMGNHAEAWGHRIINCETSYNNYRNWTSGWHAGGFKFISTAHDFVVSGHTAAYNNGCGMWFDARMSNVTIRNSVAHNNKESGIFYEIGERGVIKNNITYRNGARGIYVANSSDTLVAHNLALENGASGIAVTGSVRRGGIYGREEDEVLWVRNNIVWGNILVDNCHPDRAPVTPDGRGEPWTSRPELILPHDIPTNYNNISDYNLIYRTDGREIPFWGGWHEDIYDDLAAWQEATGNDRHSVIAEPLFLDRAGLDFRPAPGSPALELVRPHMSVDYEFAGGRRPHHGTGRYYTAGPFEAARQ